MEVLRRIQVTGRSSYIVSLPKKWIQDLKLKKGEYVVIRSGIDKNLILSPSKSEDQEKKEITVTITGSEKLNSIIRKIISLYLIGFNLIQLKSHKEKFSTLQRDVIRQLIRMKLLGAEITNESYNTITLQILLGQPDFSIGNALRRMTVISLSMLQDAMQSLKKNRSLAEDIIKMDDEVDRLSFYIVRQLKIAVQNQSLLQELGLKTPRDCLGFRLITKSIERIADHAINIAKNSLRLQESLKPTIFNEINKLSIFVDSLFEDAVKALFKNNYLDAEKIIERTSTINEIEKEISKNIQSTYFKKAETLSRIQLILESLKRIGEYAADIAEIVLNLTVLDSFIQQKK